jgi:hypothetical protein
MESQLANLVEFVSCHRWLLLSVLSLNDRAAKIAVRERAINGLNERGHFFLANNSITLNLVKDTNTGEGHLVPFTKHKAGYMTA